MFFKIFKGHIVNDGSLLTVTIAVIGGPGHPPIVGIIVKIVDWAVVVVLLSIPEIFPVPLLLIPVILELLSRVQLKMVPPTLPDKTIAVITLPEQMAWIVGVATAFGVGFTTTVAVIAVPMHPFAVGVIVNVTVLVAVVLLVITELISPLPLEGTISTFPVTLLVHA